MKLVITMFEGDIQAIHTDDPALEVQVIHTTKDQAKAAGEEIDDLVRSLTFGLTEVAEIPYIDMKHFDAIVDTYAKEGN